MTKKLYMHDKQIANLLFEMLSIRAEEELTDPKVAAQAQDIRDRIRARMEEIDEENDNG